MKERKGLLAGLLLGLVAAAALVIWQPWNTTGEPGAATGAAGGTPSAALPVIRNEGAVFAEGRISPLREALLSAEASGLIDEILVAEGDDVAAGDALLRIDSREAVLNVALAQAALAQAQANVAAAQARLQMAQEGAGVAQLGVEAAQAELAALTAGPREEALALAESAVAAANAAVAQAAGQRDVTLETDTTGIAAAQARLEAAEANLLAARQQHEPVTQNPDVSEEERAQAQLRLNAAIAAVDAARAELQALQDGATEAEARAASSAVSSAAQQQAAAQAEVTLLQAGPRPEAVQVAEAEVAQAQQTAAEAAAQVDAARSAVNQAQAQQQVAEAELQAAQTALERHTVVAPFDGVVADLLVKTGQMVGPGTPVSLVADTGTWRVVTSDLTELDVVRLEEGQTVTIHVDAFPGATLRGDVVQIAGAPTANGADVTYEVTAVLRDASDLALRWGMTAFLTAE